MATTSEVKTGLDLVAERIATQRAVVDKAKANAQSASDALAAIPTDFADLIATIDAYTGADEFETLAQAEKARLTTEFNALKTEADTIAAV